MPAWSRHACLRRRGTLALGLLVAAAGCARRPDPAPRPTETRLHDITDQLAAGTVVDGLVDPGHPGCAARVGAGWNAPETAADGMTFAWMAADTARLTLPLRVPAAGRIVVRGYGLDDRRGPRRLSLSVNGTPLGARRVPTELATLAFAVPAGALRAGDNDLALRVDRLVRPSDALGSADIRPLGLLVDAVRFIPDGAAGDAAAADPYAEPGARLAGNRSIELRPARLAGAELRLAWEATGAAPGDSVVLEIAEAADRPPRLRQAWPAGAGRSEARRVMPPDLRPKSWLRLRLAGPDGAPAHGRVAIGSATLARVVRPLNTILIVIDTLRPDHLGCYGDRRGLTPAIDGLARDGIRFENAVAAAPITGPSHASLFTSRWPCETGVLNNCTTAPSAALPLLAEMFDGLDFATGAAVSISAVTGEYGFARGFRGFADDLGCGFLAPADSVVARTVRQLDRTTPPFFLWAHFSEPHEPYDAHGLVDRRAELRLDGRPVASVSTSTYTPTAVELELPPRPAELVITSADPFRVRALAVAGLDGPPPTLTPAEPPCDATDTCRVTIGADGARRVRLEFALADLIKRGEKLRARYALEVAAADARVGALLDELRRRGLYDESLIIFASDHGEGLGEHDLVGHVENLYESLLRVPLIVKPPRAAGLPAGRTRRDLASLVDILPTVLAQLGRAPLAGARGRDLFAPDAARRKDDVVFAETHRPQSQRTLYALRGARYKIVTEPASNAWEFYDLQRDPDEQHNRYSPGNARAQAWRKRLETQLADLGLANATATPEIPVDARSRRALRALGY
ncbi:MAG: sulfatase-like hydrolase/transferase [Candidatus Krumholzibacteriia bacterium]